MRKSLFKKKFTVKDRGLTETLSKIKADFQMYPSFDFGLRKTPFKLAKGKLYLIIITKKQNVGII